MELWPALGALTAVMPTNCGRTTSAGHMNSSAIAATHLAAANLRMAGTDAG